MQKILLSLVLTFSGAQVFACEIFDGDWSCDNGDTAGVEIKKTEKGFVMKDKKIGLSFLLDGKEHRPFLPIPHKYQGSCDNTQIELSLQALGRTAYEKVTWIDTNTINVQSITDGKTYNTACKR